MKATVNEGRISYNGAIYGVGQTIEVLPEHESHFVNLPGISLEEIKADVQSIKDPQVDPSQDKKTPKTSSK